MSKQSKKPKRRAPTVFLFLTLCFCAALTYLWNVWYIPYLPKSEVPPYVDTVPDTATPITAKASATQEPEPIQDTQVSVTPSPPKESAAPEAKPVPKETTAPPATEAQTPAQQPTALRRRAGVYNFLVIGRDEAAANTDVVMLLSFDTENRTAAAVQIPRDTYLDGTKINALWAKYTANAKRNGAAEPDVVGMERLCETLEKTLCIQIDHWVFCSLAALRATVDALDGVTLDVPCDMDYDDPAQNLSIHLKKGTQTLNGAQAEQFVRFRSGYLRGDLGRVEAQKLFLSALLTELKAVSLLELPALIATAAKHTDMSLGLADLLFFAKAAQKLDLGNVTFLTLPGTDCRANGNTGTWYYILSREGTWEAVNRYLNVYETPVDGKLFDKTYRLTDQTKPTLLTYYKKHISTEEKTADDITKHGVSVAVG